VLTSEEIVLYPHHFGFEYGQDPENSIYEITNAKQLVEKHGKHGKHKKHGKHAHEHAHTHEHKHAQPEEAHEQHAASENVREFRPRPPFSTPQQHDNSIHPHFG